MRTKQIAKVPKGVIGLQEPVTGMSREHPHAGPPADSIRDHPLQLPRLFVPSHSSQISGIIADSQM